MNLSQFSPTELHNLVALAIGELGELNVGYLPKIKDAIDLVLLFKDPASIHSVQFYSSSVQAKFITKFVLSAKLAYVPNEAAFSALLKRIIEINTEWNKLTEGKVNSSTPWHQGNFDPQISFEIVLDQVVLTIQI